MKFYQQFLPYAVALSSTAIALLLTFSVEPFLLRTIGAFFYIAIIITARYGGGRPGSVAAVLSTLAINYFFIPPRYQFWLERPEDVLQLVIFLLVAFLINLFISNFRDSQQKIERLNQQLARENAELLRMAPSAAQMGMWNRNLVTQKIKWSPDHEQLFGLAPGIFDGKHETFEACLHPDDREPVNQAVQQAIKNNSLYQQEFRVVWPDGSIHWIEARGHAFYNNAGEPIQLSGTVTAIDQRKQAQGLLQKQIEQQRLVMEIAQRIRQSLNLQDILQTTVDEVRQFLQCDRTVIFEFAPDWSGIVVAESVGSNWTAILSNQIFDPCLGATYVEPYKQGLITVKSDIHDAGIDPCHLQLLTNFQVRANLVVPITKGDELWGLLIAHQCASPRQWQSSEIDLMRQLASQLSLAIQQSALFKQVQIELTERTQAEAALREREAILRLFAQYVPAGIAMFDRDMRYLMASQRWIDEYNLDAIASVINRSHYEIFPEIPERWRQIHQRCLAGGIEKCEEDLFVRADGTQQWVWWEIHPWYTATDKIGGIIIFSVDITQRKQTEIALRESQIQLQQQLVQIETIYQSAPIGLSVLDTELRFVRINQRLAQINGFSVEAHIGHTIRELLPELADAAEQLLRPILETGEPVLNVEINGETPAQPGVQRTWLESFLPLKDGERIIGINIVCEEITERKLTEAALIQAKAELEVRVAERTAELANANYDLRIEILERRQAEAALRQSEAKFRSLSECSPVGIFMTDIQGQCTYTNPRYQTICNCTFDEALGEGWVQSIHPEEREEVTAGWFKAVSARQEFSGEIRYVYRDGTIRFGRVQLAPILSVSGELMGYVGTVEDVTDSRAVEVMKNEFISIVSHELRTPLTSIRGSLGLLAAGVFKNKPESAQQMLNIAIHDTERLVRLVNDILDLERLDSQKVNLVKQWCDAATLMQQSVTTVQSLATESNIMLCVESATIQVWVDCDRIIQTLVNLVSNAIKFSPPETTVTLSVKDQAEQVLFQVKDQGRGIPADKLDTIFGRFQQVDASDARQKGGTGLGLAICKSIVQQHGGKIWVESVVGEGSSFYFTLPKFLD